MPTDIWPSSTECCPSPSTEHRAPSTEHRTLTREPLMNQRSEVAGFCSSTWTPSVAQRRRTSALKSGARRVGDNPGASSPSPDNAGGRRRSDRLRWRAGFRRRQFQGEDLGGLGRLQVGRLLEGLQCEAVSLARRKGRKQCAKAHRKRVDPSGARHETGRGRRGWHVFRSSCSFALHLPTSRSFGKAHRDGWAIPCWLRSHNRHLIPPGCEPWRPPFLFRGPHANRGIAARRRSAS